MSKTFKEWIDIIFSALLVLVAVFVGGVALYALSKHLYFSFILLAIGSLYLFGIACMGLDRLKEYTKHVQSASG